MTTRCAEDAVTLARIAAESGVAAVFACSGDGMLNSVLNGVRAAAVERAPIVGVVPAGTANVWARETGIPRTAAGALALLETGRVVEVDLGVASVGTAERAFLLMCGMGLDAEVVSMVEQRPALKRRLAQGAFVLAGAQVLWGQRPVSTVVETPEGATRRSVALAVAGNTRHYGGVARITSAAVLDDGLLDMATFEVRGGLGGIVDRFAHVGGAMLRMRGGWERVRGPRFSYEQAPWIMVRPEQRLALQLDGELFGSCGPDAPLTLRTEPKAVRMLVPWGANVLYPSATTAAFPGA